MIILPVSTCLEEIEDLILLACIREADVNPGRVASCAMLPDELPDDDLLTLNHPLDVAKENDVDGTNGLYVGSGTCEMLACSHASDQLVDLGASESGCDADRLSPTVADRLQYVLAKLLQVLQFLLVRLVA